MSLTEKRAALESPFPFEEIDYRVVATANDKKRGQVAFYLTARAAMNRLDDAGCEWSDAFTVLDTKHVECRLTVDGVTRCDVGETNEGGQADEIKAAYSDAFKRAAVKFGIGRYLYEGRRLWVDLDEYKQPARDQLDKIAREYGFLTGTAVPAPEPARNGHAPAPRRAETGGVNSFWVKAREMGFDAPRVFEIAGVTTFRGFSDEQLSAVLEKLQEAVPA